ncbi:hypothetical protein K2173_010519 [Erythroxylum novogranatense]|uniref:Inner centromere protein ARK-binding domain-containing protein n=1 Tax=Erythroxylum novogranatense TaxID=1862640 RepID=A0AAV8TEA4_9ROSI|nr:hypothetical protein K2173_010519 [Erythroxylum novogranatense]
MATTTAAMEKMLVEIFERKKWMVEQAKHMVDSFDHHLASKCILAGISPPPFLLLPKANELNKEELLLSGFLVPHFQHPTARYSTFNFQTHVAASHNHVLPNHLSTKLHASNDVDMGSSVKSPRGCTDKSLLDDCPDQSQSLANIQRSKSRQRALRLRSSAKSVKPRPSEDNVSTPVVGSGIASLQYDNACDTNLIKPVDASNGICMEEKAKTEKSRGEGNSGDIHNRGTMTCTTCSQKKGSINGSRSICGNCSDVAKEDGLANSVNQLIQQSNHGNGMLEQFKLSLAADNPICEAEVILGDCKGSKRSSILFPGSPQPSSAKESLDVDERFKPFPVADDPICETEEVIMGDCKGSKRSSILFPGSPQPSSAKEPLDVDEQFEPFPVADDPICEAEEVILGDCKGSKRSGILFPGGPQPSSIKEPLDVGKSSFVAKKNSSLGESIDKLESNSVERLSESDNTSPTICNGSHGMSKEDVCGNQSDEKENNVVYSGSILQSRNFGQEPVKNCYTSDKEVGCLKQNQLLNDFDNVQELVKSFDNANINHQEFQARTWDSQSDEGRVDAYCCRITRDRSTEQLIRVNELSGIDVPSVIAGHDDFGLAPSGKCSQPPSPLRSYQREGTKLQEVLGTRGIVLSSTESDSIDGLEMDNSVVLEMYMDSDIPAERVSGNCHVMSDPSLDGTQVGVQLIVPRPSTECLMFVKPKQLDFDDVGECSLNETSGPVFDNEKQDISLEGQTFASPYCSKIMEDKVASVDNIGNLNSFNGITVLNEQKVSCKDFKSMKDSSEGCMDKCALLVDENITKVVRKDLSLAVSHKQDADSYFMGSWPQCKRIKTGDQIANSLAASPSLIKPFQSVDTVHVHSEVNPMETNQHFLQKSDGLPIQTRDSMISNFRNSLVEDMHQNIEHYVINGSELSSPKLEVEKVNLSMERKVGSPDAAFTLMGEQLGIPTVSGMTLLANGFSKDHLSEKAELDCTNVCVGPVGMRAGEENQVPLHLEDRLELEEAEILCQSEKGIQQRKSYLGGTDEVVPEFEGFVMETDGEQPRSTRDIIDLDNLELPKAALERASILEQLCRSACLHTPLSHFSTTYRLHETLNLHQSIPNGILKGLTSRNASNVDGEILKQREVSYSSFKWEPDTTLDERCLSDSLTFPNTISALDANKPYISPVGKFWDAIASKSGSSEKRASSVPDLPCISEENENIDELTDTFGKSVEYQAMLGSAKREPLAEITKSSNLPISICESETVDDRSSLASVNTEFSFTGNCNRTKFGNDKGNKKKYDRNTKDNQIMSVGANGGKRVDGSLHSRFNKPKLSGKTSSRNHGPSLSVKKSKPDNIVSNITSFIPLVQQNQEAAIITGKREIKVKALQAAEEAKLLAEKKENERRMRKEALKLERARMEEQNLRQLELQKEKKEVERKKKQADLAAKKRHREEEEKKEKERKKKRVEEVRRQQLEQGEKLRAAAKEVKCLVADERQHEKTVAKDKLGKQEDIKSSKGQNNVQNGPQNKVMVIRDSTNDAKTESIANGDKQTLCDYSEEMSEFCKITDDDNLSPKIIQEQSYEISPYKGSDDEDDEEDDEIPNTKFTPPWVSKSHLVQMVSSQQGVDPKSIFPPRSFCSISEVLLPRKLQQKQWTRQ